MTPILVILLMLLPAVSGFPEEIGLGRTDGWSSLRTEDNISIIGAESGRARIILADRENSPRRDTEMLFHFNDDLRDSSGNYSIKMNSGVETSAVEKKRGAGSAVFFGSGEMLELIPDKGASFAAGSSISDFTIEFWLNPVRLSEGETILRWQAAIETDDDMLQQEVICGVSGRIIYWQFNNFFLTPELEGTHFTLSSEKSIIPKRWHHHMLRYQRQTGLLEYLIDGVPETVTHVSRDGRESEELYSPIIGAAKPSSFIIGRGFTGYIDELQILNSYRDETDLRQYPDHSGTAVTDIIDLKYYDSRLLSISSSEDLPGETRINYFYRISNDYFSPAAEYPSWNQLLPGEQLPPGVEGRWLQVMAELFPDGTGERTPELSEIYISYNKNLPPQPPGFVTAAAVDKGAVISWKAVNDSDIAGYRIYYGNSPGIYFSTGPDGGNSPIDTGNVNSFVINGLENGKLYYFAVTSYDDAEIPQESIFSLETSVRPSAIFRNN